MTSTVFNGISYKLVIQPGCGLAAAWLSAL